MALSVKKEFVTRQRHCLQVKALIIPEKRVVYVVSWPTRIDVGPHKRIFTHVGLNAHAHNIVQEVEVHEWLLSGIRLTILC